MHVIVSAPYSDTMYWAIPSAEFRGPALVGEMFFEWKHSRGTPVP